MDDRFMSRLSGRGEVRFATPDDWETVTRLYEDCLTEEGHAMGTNRHTAIADWVLRLLRDGPDLALVLVRDGRIVAQIFASLRLAEPWEDKPVLSTYGMYVVPDERTQGTPLPIFRRCVDLARKYGANLNILESTVSKNKAGYFERGGFKPIGILYQLEV